MRLALLLIFSLSAWGQLKFDTRTVAGRASDQLKETQRVLRVAQQSAWREARTPEELAVVEAVAKVFHAHFLPELNLIPQIATLTERGRDILVARWTNSDQSAFSELIVWDAPESTSFIFKMPVRSWSSDATIQATFEKLVSPSANGVTLNVASDAQTNQWIGAGALLIGSPRQFDLGATNWIDLWETGSSSYLCVSFSGYATPEYPGVMRWVPERFPPLESRVGKWTKTRILHELSCGPEARQLQRRYFVPLVDSTNRAGILARELLKRTLTDDELLAVLMSRPFYQNGVVLQAVMGSGEAQRFENAMRMYSQAEQGGSGMMGNHPFYEPCKSNSNNH